MKCENRVVENLVQGFGLDKETGVIYMKNMRGKEGRDTQEETRARKTVRARNEKVTQVKGTLTRRKKWTEIENCR